MPSPSAATQLCEDTDATAQEGQPSENGSENWGRAGLGRPVPCLTFAFIGEKKTTPPGRAAAARKPPPACSGEGLRSPIPSSPRPPATPSSPRSFVPSSKGASRQPGAHGKEQPKRSGIGNPTPALRSRPPFSQRTRGAQHGESHRAPGGDADVPSPLPATAGVCGFCPAKPRQQSPRRAGKGTGRGRNAGDGAGTSGLDVLGDALGQGGPCSQGKRFPSNSPNLGGRRVKITNERFIDTRAVGRRKQTAIHPARVPSARHAIDKNSERGSVRFMGRARKTRHCPPGSRNAAFEAGDGDGRPPAPRPRPHNAPLFGAGRV